MKKNYLLPVVLLLSSIIIKAQQPQIELNWLRTAQLYLNGGSFEAEAIANCSDGSIVVVGNFEHTVDFDPGPDSFNITAISGYDNFVAKYSSQGKLLFAFAIGGHGSDKSESANAVITDEDDNIYVAGTFSGTADFNPGNLRTILSAPVEVTNNFIACYRKNGSLKFVKNVTDSKETDKSQNVNSIAIDKNKNIFITGTFWGDSVDFDPGPGFTSLKGLQKDVFFAKYDSLGNFLFVKALRGHSYDNAYKIAIDKKSNILICGNFESSRMDVDPEDSTEYLYLKGEQDLFFAKYDSTGNYIFAKNIGGTYKNNAKALVVGNDNSFILTGEFYGKLIDFNPGGTMPYLLSNKGSNDAFIAKYDENGNCLFAFNIGGTGNDLGTDVGLDKNNHIICTGSFSGNTVDFDPGSNTFQIKESKTLDNYIAKYTYEGNFILAESFGNGSYFTNPYSKINCLSVMPTGKILVGGFYYLSLDVDPGPDSTLITSPEPTMFVSKYDADGKFLDVIGGGNYFNYYASRNRVTSSVLDKQDNLYVTGTFTGRYDFDPGPGTAIIESVDDYRDGGFFAKYNSAGKLIFVKAITGGEARINDIAVDDKQNIYITGLATSATDFDPTDSIQHFDNGDSTGQKQSDGFFFAKYSAKGNLIFAKGEGNSNNFYLNVTSIALDKQNNICIAGQFDSWMDLDTGPDQYLLYGGYYDNGFFAKYTSQGNFLFAGVIRSEDSFGEVFDLKIDSKNNIVITGTYDGNDIDFDIGPGKHLLSSPTSISAYIATYKSNGTYGAVISTESINDYEETIFQSLTLDAEDNIYVAGKSRGKVDFKPGSGKVLLPDPAGLCFASYSNSGKLRFLKGIQVYSPSQVLGNNLTAINLDKQNNIYVAGHFESKDIDCDPGSDTALLVNENYDGSYIAKLDLFTAKYNYKGEYIYAYNLDGDSAVGDNRSVAILIDNADNIYYTGFAQTKINFSTTNKPAYLHPTSYSTNTFITKYRPVTGKPELSDASIAKANILPTIKVYPNPITDKINIQLNNIILKNTTATISLYDAKGRCLQTNKSSFTNHNLNTILTLPKNLSAGIYFIKIDIEGKTYYSNTLIK